MLLELLQYLALVEHWVVGQMAAMGMEQAGTLLRFQNCGCRFSDLFKTLKRFFFEIKSGAKGQLLSKSQSAKSLSANSVFLNICQCSCTHFTHNNKDPEQETLVTAVVETVMDLHWERMLKITTGLERSHLLPGLLGPIKRFSG